MAFYDINKSLSHNAMVNVVVGNRGGGKTFAFKQHALKAWKRDKSEWVYVRRYEDELSTRSTFWDDIIAHTDDMAGYEVKIHGWKCYIRKGETNVSMADNKSDSIESEWEPFGYFVALADAQKFKSTSLPKVSNICFDEFIIENTSRRYIKNEFDMFVGLVDTIDRDDSRCHVWLLSNAGALNNPYFIAWNVKPTDVLDAKKGYLKRRGGVVCVEWWSGKGKEKSGSLVDSIASEVYNNYAQHNIFKDSGMDGVDTTLKGKGRVMFTLTDGESYVDLCVNGADFFFGKCAKRKDVKTYIMRDGMLVQGAFKINNHLRQFLKSGRVQQYDSLETKHKAANCMQMIV